MRGFGRLAPVEGEAARRATAWADRIVGRWVERAEGGLGAMAPSQLSSAALLFGYAGQGRGDERLLELSRACLREAVKRTTPLAHLCGGLTGTALTAALLGGLGVAPANQGYLKAVDRALLADLETYPEWGADLFFGLTGTMVYALARHPAGGASALLARAIELLEQRAVREGGGVTWRTLFDDNGRPFEPGAEPAYNLGAAHGVTSLLPVLAAAQKRGVEAERARSLLEGLSAWMQAQRLDRGGEGRGAFAMWAGPGMQRPEYRGPSRLAWCYGDAGVAAAYAAAAELVDDPGLRAVASSVATIAARRPDGKTGVEDAFLCHGAAGLSHLFWRLGAQLGDRACGEAAERWLGHTLALLDRDAREGDGSSPLYSRDLGVALFLLSATGQAECSWDCFLGLTVEGAGSG